MSWPLSQDFNEAVQNPATAFADPDLKSGTVTTNPMGMPVPRSGNYADVYQINAANGQKWAVKCFTRPTSAGLDSRYAAVSEHLANANLPFTVGFNFLPQGIRIRGHWYPIVKMQWVDGFPINSFVRDNLNRSSILENMLSLWVRLTRRLRETGMAHGDIQHGNVLLVPAGGNSLGLKLVDYDGMFVPALANLPTGEAGHASFQHPERVPTANYSADLDRFPHLVVATALRGLLVGGKALWDKYDTGDNLLFTEKDFKNPGQSKLMKELWETGDPFTVGLVGHLLLSCTKPMHQTPWLDQLMPGGQPPILTPSQERQAASIIGLNIGGATPAAPAPGLPPMPVVPPQYSPPPQYPPQYPPQQYAPPQYAPPPQQYAPPQAPTSPSSPRPVAARKDLTFDSNPGDGSIRFDDEGGRRRRQKSSAAGNSNIVIAVVAGVVVLAGIVGATIFLSGGKKPTPEVVNKPPDNPPPVDPPVVKPPVDPPVNPIPPVDPPVVKPMPPDPMPPVNPNRPPVGNPNSGKVAWAVPVDDGRRTAHAVAFTLDGQRILVAPEQAGLVHVLDARTGQRSATFRDHEPPANIHPFPLPKNKVMSAGREPVLLVWDAETGKASGRSVANTKVGLDVVRADFTGKYAIMMWDKTGRVVDLESGAVVTEMPLPNATLGIGGATIAPDGGTMLVVTPEKRIQVVELPSLKKLSDHALNITTQGALVSDWSPSQKMAALRLSQGASLPAGVTVVSTETGQVLHTITGGAIQVQCRFAAGGKRLITLATDRVDVWDTSTWAKVGGASVRLQFTKCMDVNLDGSRVCYVDQDSKVVCVNLTGGGGTTTTPTPPSANEALVNRLTEVDSLATVDLKLELIRKAAIDRTGKMAYLATDTTLYPVDVANKKVTNKYTPDGRIRQIWATFGGEVVLEVRKDQKTELHVVDPQTGKLTGAEVIPIADDNPKHLNVSAGGAIATVVKANGHIAVFTLKNGRVLYTYHPDPMAISAFPSADGTMIVANCGKRINTYLIADRPRFRWVIPERTETNDLVVEDAAPDGKAIALRTRGADNTGTKFVVMTFADWKNPATILTPATGNGAQLRFVGDSQRVVLSDDSRVTLYEATTGKPIVSATPKMIGGTMVPVPGPGGETLVLGSGTGVTIYRTTGGMGMVAVEPPPMPDTPKRLVIPNAASLMAAEKMVKETYAAEYAKKLPADRKQLGTRLLTDAKETAKDPPAQYFMLKESHAIGIEVIDPVMILKSADALNEIFDVDGFALKLASLEKVATTATQTPALKATAEAIQELVEELVEKDEFDKAVKLSAVAVSCYSRAGATAQQKELEQRLVQLKKLRDSFESLKAAAEKLKTMPEDKDANAQVGKFRGFLQGRWDDAFKMLAIGSDADLKKLAEMELQAANDADTTNVKRGDMWREYSVKLPEADRGPATARSKFWYAKALTSNRAGLDRANAEKWLKFGSGTNEFWPGLILEQFAQPGTAARRKFKGTIEYSVDFVTDSTELQNLNITTVGGKWTGVIVSPTAGRYKIIADTKDEMRVTLGTKPDEKKLLEALPKGLATKEAYYLFSERPVAITVEYAGPVRPNRGIKLKWIRPGAKSEEIIPASAFFHNKTDEKLVTEK